MDKTPCAHPAAAGTETLPCSAEVSNSQPAESMTSGVKRKQHFDPHLLRGVEEGKIMTGSSAEDCSKPASDLQQADAATLQRRERLRIIRSTPAVLVKDANGADASAAHPTEEAEAQTAKPADRGAPAATEEVTQQQQEVEESARSLAPPVAKKTKSGAVEPRAGAGAAAQQLEESAAGFSAPAEASDTAVPTAPEIKTCATFSSAFATLQTQRGAPSSFFLSPSQTASSNSSSENAAATAATTTSIPLFGSSSLFTSGSSLLAGVGFPGSCSSTFTGSPFHAAATAGGSGSEDGNGAEDPKPEEYSVIEGGETSEDEELLFTDRDCRMQRFDTAQLAWVPKPPLDGRLQVVSSKKEEDKGACRLLFFVHRTGRLQLNSPLFATVHYHNPIDRARQRFAGAAAAADNEKAAAEGEAAKSSETDEKPAAAESKEQQQNDEKDMPKKLNTAEFLALKIDAQSSSDTTMFRVRFSSEEKCEDFLTLVNQKKLEGANITQQQQHHQPKEQGHIQKQQ